MLPFAPVDTLLHDDLQALILCIADDLAEQFVAAMEENKPGFDINVALAGLELTFLSRVAQLTRGQQP